MRSLSPFRSSALLLSLLVSNTLSAPVSPHGSSTSNPTIKKPSSGIFNPPAAQPKLRTVLVRIPDPTGDALLVVPPDCSVMSCPLLLVSHPLGAIPEYGIDFVNHAGYAQFLERFSQAGYALLLSSDGGRETWGNVGALENTYRVWNAALGRFDYSGQTFSLGVSMGALPATLLGLTGRIPLEGTITIGGVLNLPDIYRRSDPTYPASLTRAYSLPTQVSDAQLAYATMPHDPIGGTLFFSKLDIPFLAIGSRGDTRVPLERNATAFVRQMQPFQSDSRVLEVTGPHLSAAHFSEEVSRAALEFLGKYRR